MKGIATRWMTLDLRQFRFAGVAMMAAAFVVPLLAGVFPEAWCPLRAATGVPCCLCGMTTSVTATMHGDLGTAIAANPFGVVAVATAVGLLFVRNRRQIRVPVAALVLAAAVSWVWQLGRYGFL